MRWSYAELQATPAPVLEELARWMREIADETDKTQREQARAASLPRPRGRHR